MCNCKADIALITYRDEKTKKLEVSHGVCTNCLRNITLAGGHPSEYLKLGGFITA